MSKHSKPPKSAKSNTKHEKTKDVVGHTVDVSPTPVKLFESKATIMPDDVCYEILKFLDRKEVMESYSLVSKQWYLVAIRQFPVHLKVKSFYYEPFQQIVSHDCILFQQKANITSFAYHYDGIGSNWLVNVDSCYFKILSDCLKDTVTNLSLYGAEIDEKGMSFLENFKHVHSLTLEVCKINPKDLKYVQNLENLTSLNMRHTKVGSVGTKIISSMKQLKSLGLCRTEIDHGAIRNICALTDLQSLDIGLSDIKKDLLTFVCSQLRNLTSLDIGSTWCGDAEVKIICEKLPKLTSLNLSCNGSITYDSLVQLSKLSELSNLSLRGCSQIGSDPEYDVQVISLMKNLTTLDLDGTILKPDHIETIRLALAPKLKTLIYEVYVYEKDEDDIRYC